jgi:ribonuclease HI
MNLYVYTDGSCKGNPGKGGYAYTIYDEFGELLVKASGTERETTNNKMELSAAIEALRCVVKNYTSVLTPNTIIIYSDSSYLVNCFNENWIQKWESNGWKTYKKEDVLNKEFWEVLYELVKKTGAVFEKLPRKDERIKEVDREARLASINLR